MPLLLRQRRIQTLIRIAIPQHIECTFLIAAATTTGTHCYIHH